jgi:hypothetical protein
MKNVDVGWSSIRDGLLDFSPFISCLKKIFNMYFKLKLMIWAFNLFKYK